MLCAKFQSDWTAETDVLDEPDLARFEFKMSFGPISHVAQGPSIVSNLYWTVIWLLYRYFVFDSDVSIGVLNSVSSNTPATRVMLVYVSRFEVWQFRILAAPICDCWAVRPFRNASVSVFAISGCGRYGMFSNHNGYILKQSHQVPYFAVRYTDMDKINDTFPQ